MGHSPGTIDEPTRLGDGAVTLVEGSSFCICGPAGDIRPRTPQGLFIRDTRLLDTWQLSVNGEAPETLAVLSEEPWSATFLSRARANGQPHANLFLARERALGQGMHEELALTNLSNHQIELSLRLTFDCDFADLFQVKEGLLPKRPTLTRTERPNGVRVLRRYPSGAERGIDLQWPGATGEGAGLRLDLIVPPRGTARSRIEVFPLIDGHRARIRHPVGGAAGEQARVWRESSAAFRVADPEWNRTLQRSKVDLGALRITDPEHPEVTVLAAGVPWFMALFGRDSLLASYMALALDPALALGTLKTLARLQGSRVEENSEEEPGRILHEVRFGADPSLALGGRSVYYGSADATPLFVVLLGEVLRWGASPAQIQTLLPHADRALEWLARHEDDADHPFVVYRRATSQGLRNQGWKDSWDGVTHADGRLAEAPVALCEVQGYAYAALTARAEIAAVLGEEEIGRHCAARAARLRTAFNEQFWMPGRQAFALALDGERRPVDSLASNMGHCLWSGIVDQDKAAAVVEHLMSADMFSGWGIRTLATSMTAYNPMSYHNGSVWPHDNALIVDGLMSYGFVAQARQVAAAQLDAAAAFGGRLPELFCGFAREDYPRPVPFPTSCSPQAWASAAPIHLLRTLLRLDPRLPGGGVHLAPTLPAGNDITITNLRLGDDHVTLRVDGAGARLDGLGGKFGGRQ